MWLDYKTGNEAQNKYFATQIRVVGTQANAMTYKEEILNGAYPVISNGLVPVTIAEDGTVSKASLSSKWYSYADKIWANAVILKDESINYKDDDIIPEDNIESYFVWIPKYSYQIWDLGNYNSLTSIASKEQEIKIRFGTANTTDDIEGECTTPMSGSQAIAESNGNCEIGNYMTHPAFLAFNPSGFWVGKFETGYDGATTTSAAQVNSVDTNKIIIKPNVYSWRNISLGNAFKNSFDYRRELISHMMKNTEWGAVAYLQHSNYGSKTSVRVNNNSSFITGYAAVTEPSYSLSSSSIDGNRNESTLLGVDGLYTVNYLNSNSNVASTTGNISGIYDMSGGAWEYVMGYTTLSTNVGSSSDITSLYSDFFTNSFYDKYWDKYSSNASTNYNNRVLGDATGEMGPFANQVDHDNASRTKTSWYTDYAIFVSYPNSWFLRGGHYYFGSGSGIFAFSTYSGKAAPTLSYRIVLSPSK